MLGFIVTIICICIIISIIKTYFDFKNSQNQSASQNHLSGLSYFETKPYEDLYIQDLNFVAIDFETANSDPSSLCQIGMVRFHNGIPVDTFESLINPEMEFDSANISIHGIDTDDVDDDPTFPMLYERIKNFIGSDYFLAHTGFDKNALTKCCERYNLPMFENMWLDSSDLARDTWSSIRYKGYGLAPLCERFAIPLDHHDALSDARAAGRLFVRIFAHKPFNLSEGTPTIPTRYSKQSTKSDRKNSPKSKRIPNLNGHLNGQCLTFTGELKIVRAIAADKAAEAGCVVTVGVTKKTTLLVVGEQDSSALRSGEAISTSHQKALDYIAKGQSIKIINENEFIDILTPPISKLI